MRHLLLFWCERLLSLLFVPPHAERNDAGSPRSHARLTDKGQPPFARQDRPMGRPRQMVHPLTPGAIPASANQVVTSDEFVLSAHAVSAAVLG
jgi:hypothetical protein